MSEGSTDAATGAGDDSEDEEEGGPGPRISIEAPAVGAADRLAGWWVAMANEQRAHRSHLLGEPNRRLIREAMARHVVTDGLLVARLESAGSPDTEALPSDLDAPSGSDETGALQGPTGGSSESLLEAGLSGQSDPSQREKRRKRGWRKRSEVRSDELGARRAAGRIEDVVGFVMFGPETGSYEQSVDRGVIENVFVHPDYRDRGIGDALLDAAETALADSGVDTIALEVMAENDDARRFYARRGYRPHRLELEVPAESVPGESEREDDPAPGNDKHTNERDFG